MTTMYADVVDLREFYRSPLGRTAQRLLHRRLRQIWPNTQNQRLLALGYGIPFLQNFLNEADVVTAAMPAAQGVVYWPHEGPNVSCLSEPGHLPLPDNSIDRILMVHALEGSAEPHAMMREVWRVLKSNGQILLIVPNRRGLWAHSEHTPFGTGQPYSMSQIKRLFRDHGFLVDRSWCALYLPPSTSRLSLSLADPLEKYGERLFPGFGGLLLAEASKQLYAPILTKSRGIARLILPLPEPDPLPAN